MGFWTTFVCGVGAGMGLLMLLVVLSGQTKRDARSLQISEESLAASKLRNTIDGDIESNLRRIADKMEEQPK